MTDHEMLLLRAAVENLGADFLTVADAHAQWPARAGLTHGKVHEAGTLAEALTAHLHKQDVPVPEWPSREEIAELDLGLATTTMTSLDYFSTLPLPELLALVRHHP